MPRAGDIVAVAEMGMGWGIPGAFYSEGTHRVQLKLKSMQAGVTRILNVGVILAGQLKPKQGAGWGSKVLQTGWNQGKHRMGFPGCSVQGAPWQGG